MRIFVLTVILFFSMGCSTLLNTGKAACELALGGSKAGELCASIDLLKKDQPAEVEEVTSAE